MAWTKYMLLCKRVLYTRSRVSAEAVKEDARTELLVAMAAACCMFGVVDDARVFF